MRVALSGVFWLLLANSLGAQHRLDVYAVEPAAGCLRFGHVFAVLDGTHTFSWMPVGPVRLLGSQPGRNWTYAETVAQAAYCGGAVVWVGCCPLDEACYQRGLRLLEDMRVGRVRYGLLGMNCAQTVSLLSGTRAVTGLASGVRAGQLVLNHLWRSQCRSCGSPCFVSETSLSPAAERRGGRLTVMP